MRTEKRRASDREYQQRHCEEIGERNRRFSKENRERCRENQRRSNEKLKKEVLSYYSGGKLICVLCGESRLPALTIDHVNNNGAEHRNKLKLGAGIIFYRWLRKQNFPEGYQTLCMNCQFVKVNSLYQRKEG